MSLSTEELRGKVAKKLEANPGVKTGMMADALGVAEADVLRVMPEGHVLELPSDDMEGLLREIETLGLVYFVTRNGACVAEIKGRFGGFSHSGPFFNVSGDGIHLHLKLAHLGSAFFVNPKMPEGRPAMPSLQFFQTDGVMAFKVFLIQSMQEEAGDNFAESVEKLHELVERRAKNYPD